MAAGYAGGYFPQQDMAALMAQITGRPAADTAAGLTQRYNNAPESFGQLATINNWNQPQGGQGAPAPAPQAPPAPAPPAPGGAAPMGGGGGSLAELRAMIMGLNPDDKINQAFDLQTKQGLTDMGMGVEDNLAARGVQMGSATGQDLESRLKGQLLGQLGSQRASALANAQTDRLGRLTSLTGMEMDQQRQQQEAAYRSQRDAADDAARNAQMAMQQRQADQAAQANTAASAWQQQQEAWAREDRTKQTQEGQVQQAMREQLMPSGGGMPDAAANARALIMGGSGGRTAADVLGGGAAPITPTGQPMGGGAGLGGAGAGTGFGDPTPGWNSGAGRSDDPNRKQFLPASTQQAPGGALPGAVPGAVAGAAGAIAGAGAGAAAKPKTALYQPNPKTWGTA